MIIYYTANDLKQQVQSTEVRIDTWLEDPELPVNFIEDPFFGLYLTLDWREKPIMLGGGITPDKYYYFVEIDLTYAIMLLEHPHPVVKEFGLRWLEKYSVA